MHASKWIYLPTQMDEIRVSIDDLLEVRDRGRSFEGLRLPAHADDFDGSVLQECFRAELIGLSPSMLEVVQQIFICCDSPLPVEIVGEPGTELFAVAKSIHNCSVRRTEQFWSAPCRGLSTSTVENNLPIGGTMFLSGIDFATADLQVMVAQLIEEGRVRVLVATERILNQTERDESLYFLSDQFRDKIEIPPLCLRPTDLPLLLYYHIQRFNVENSTRYDPGNPKVEGVFLEDLYYAMASRWPKNLNQLAEAVRAGCWKSLRGRPDSGVHLELNGPERWIFAPDPCGSEALDELLVELGHHVSLDELMTFDLAAMMEWIDDRTQPEYRGLWFFENRQSYVTLEKKIDGSTEPLVEMVGSPLAPGVSGTSDSPGGELELFRYFGDYVSIVYKGVSYSLTPGQAVIIRALHEAHLNGTPDVTQSYLLDLAGSPVGRLRSFFRGRNRELWRTLIVPGRAKGTYRLNLHA